MIVTEHVNIKHTACKKINLNHGAIVFYDHFENIDLNLLTINKTRIKNTNTVSY